MKKILNKIIVLTLVAIISINYIFPNFVLAINANLDPNQAYGVDFYKDKIAKLIDYKIQKKIESIFKDNHGISKEDARKKLDEYFEFISDRYALEDEGLDEISDYKKKYPEDYTDASTKAYAEEIYNRIEVEYLNYSGERYITGQNLQEYHKIYIDSIATNLYRETLINNYINNSEEKIELDTEEIPDAPKPYGGDGTNIESEVRNWINDKLNTYSSYNAKLAFLDELESNWEIILDDFEFNSDKNNLEVIVKEIISQKRDELKKNYSISSEQAKNLLFNKLSILKTNKNTQYKDETQEDRNEHVKAYFIGLMDEFKRASGDFYNEVITDIASRITNQGERLDFISKVPDYMNQWINDNIGTTVTMVDNVFRIFGGGGVDSIAGLVFTPFKLILLIIPGAILQVAETLLANTGNQGQAVLVKLEDVFFNKLPLLDINVFNLQTAAGANISGNNPLLKIRQNVAAWYYSIRTLCIVLALAVLIYIGIRMAISSIADDKAKYKKMLKDWFVGFALLFVLHYIMIGIIHLNNGLIDALEETRKEQEAHISSVDTGILGIKIQTDVNKDLQTALLDEALTLSFTRSFGAALIYLMLLAMTLLFLIVYIKRFITISFLAMISPIITVTYAIDKAGDGKAQALGKWFKEFVFNILIQPFHCIIYMVFLQNIFYIIHNSEGIEFGNIFVAILMLGFMYKAEDIVKEIFGFETKSLGSAAIVGAAMLSRAQKVGSRVANLSKGIKGGPNAAEKASAIKNMNTPDGLPSQARNVPDNTPKQSQNNNMGNNTQATKKEGIKSEIGRWAKTTSGLGRAEGKTARNLAGRAVSAAIGYGLTGEGQAAYGASKAYTSTKKSIDNARLRRQVDKKQDRTLDAYEDYAQHKGLDTREARLKEAQRLMNANIDDLEDPAERNMAGWLQADKASQEIAGAKDAGKAVMGHLKDYEDGIG